MMLAWEILLLSCGAAEHKLTQPACACCCCLLMGFYFFFLLQLSTIWFALPHYSNVNVLFKLRFTTTSSFNLETLSRTIDLFSCYFSTLHSSSDILQCRVLILGFTQELFAVWCACALGLAAWAWRAGVGLVLFSLSLLSILFLKRQLCVWWAGWLGSVLWRVCWLHSHPDSGCF